MEVFYLESRLYLRIVVVIGFGMEVESILKVRGRIIENFKFFLLYDFIIYDNIREEKLMILGDCYS